MKEIKTDRVLELFFRAMKGEELSVQALAGHIEEHRAITVTYHRMDRQQVTHKLKPLSLMFSEYYYYLIACKYEDESETPICFRVDRITNIVAHREHFHLRREQEFDEDLLRRRSQFMWPGKLRTVRFEFTGPSVQAVLDRLPTARVLDIRNGVTTIEAEVYGDGIKMYLLSQGSWVKVIGPAEFAAEMRDEIRKMSGYYENLP